jgi:hypothetical protein
MNGTGGSPSGDELGDEGVGELAGQVLGVTEGGFEGVAELHELVDLGDDALLLGEGGSGTAKRRR